MWQCSRTMRLSCQWCSQRLDATAWMCSRLTFWFLMACVQGKCYWLSTLVLSMKWWSLMDLELVSCFRLLSLCQVDISAGRISELKTWHLRNKGQSWTCAGILHVRYSELEAHRRLQQRCLLEHSWRWQPTEDLDDVSWHRPYKTESINRTAGPAVSGFFNRLQPMSSCLRKQLSRTRNWWCFAAPQRRRLLLPRIATERKSKKDLPVLRMDLWHADMSDWRNCALVEMSHKITEITLDWIVNVSHIPRYSRTFIFHQHRTTINATKCFAWSVHLHEWGFSVSFDFALLSVSKVALSPNHLFCGPRAPMVNKFILLWLADWL